jgi:hypothetical protein
VQNPGDPTAKAESPRGSGYPPDACHGDEEASEGQAFSY